MTHLGFQGYIATSVVLFIRQFYQICRRCAILASCLLLIVVPNMSFGGTSPLQQISLRSRTGIQKAKIVQRHHLLRQDLEELKNNWGYRSPDSFDRESRSPTFVDVVTYGDIHLQIPGRRKIPTKHEELMEEVRALADGINPAEARAAIARPFYVDTNLYSRSHANEISMQADQIYASQEYLVSALTEHGLNRSAMDETTTTELDTKGTVTWIADILSDRFSRIYGELQYFLNLSCRTEDAPISIERILRRHDGDQRILTQVTPITKEKTLRFNELQALIRLTNAELSLFRKLMESKKISLHRRGEKSNAAKALGGMSATFGWLESSLREMSSESTDDNIGLKVGRLTDMLIRIDQLTRSQFDQFLNGFGVSLKVRR